MLARSSLNTQPEAPTRGALLRPETPRRRCNLSPGLASRRFRTYRQGDVYEKTSVASHSRGPAVPTVGIGASAGGVEAL
jgi:hypothetical protein